MPTYTSGIRQRFHGVFQSARSALQLAACLCILVTTAAGGDYTSYKISGTSPNFMDISYFQFEFSPDGRYVIFVADRDTDGKYELYSVPVTGREPTCISRWIVTYNVLDFVITPDSQYVLFTAEKLIPGQSDLYRVPITGGSKPVRLNLPNHAEAGIDANSIRISPNGLVVVFKGDQEINGEYNLYSVPISGITAPVRLNDDIIPPGGGIDMHQISPDSQRVVYRADQEVYREKELFSVPIGGGTVVQLNETLIEDGYVSTFEITPVNPFGMKVVYSAVQETTGIAELYAVPIAGGAHTKLNENIFVGHGVGKFSVTPNGQGVVYIADQDTLYVDELFSVYINGTPGAKLNPLMGENGDVIDFHITSNISGLIGVVFMADSISDERFKLFSCLITGGPLYTLDVGLPAEGSVYSFEITPNNLGVVFLRDTGPGTNDQLYANWIDGSITPVQLNEDLTGADFVSHFEISPNSQRVIYMADQDTTGVREVYSVPTIGGPSEKLNLTPVVNGIVDYFRISPDSQNVIFKGDLEVNDKAELYISVPADHVYLPAVRR